MSINNNNYRYIYHYTNFGAFENILKSKTLRLYDCDTMPGDKTDRIYALQKIREMLKNFKEFDSKSIIKSYKNVSSTKNYAISFGTKYTNKYLWDYFAYNEGVVIEIDKTYLIDKINEIIFKNILSIDGNNEIDLEIARNEYSFNSILRFRKIKYEYNGNDLKEDINELNDIYTNISDNKTKEYYKNNYIILPIMLKRDSFILNSCFSNETEYRLLYKDHFTKKYMRNNPYFYIKEIELDNVFSILGLKKTKRDRKKKRCYKELSIKEFEINKLITNIYINDSNITFVERIIDLLSQYGLCLKPNVINYDNLL